MSRKRGILSIEGLPDIVKGKSIADSCLRHELATKFVATLLPFNEEVISIIDDATHQSEGIQGASKQPIVEMYDYDDPIASFQGKILATNKVFVPKWNLNHDSRISNHEVAAEFSHHDFPKDIVYKMEAFSDDQTIDIMEFSSTWIAFCSIVGSRHIRHLKIIVVKLHANEKSAQQHVASLEVKVDSSHQQRDLLVGEKMNFKECCTNVEINLDTLHRNEALSI
ncbi:unnamed protein product [Lactuca saligna]|uniref:Uncharacterized protein n=1 Tax=Lactuca saligna TaxID=75948 RepID=A0AA35YSC6_LACSI|nr:unnamed protein product [Lactuca saligna]